MIIEHSSGIRDLQRIGSAWSWTVFNEPTKVGDLVCGDLAVFGSVRGLVGVGGSVAGIVAVRPQVRGLVDVSEC